MVIYLSRSQTNIEVPILLPAEPDVVQPIITQLNECGIGEGPISVKIIMTTEEKYGILAAWKS